MTPPCSREVPIKGPPVSDEFERGFSTASRIYWIVMLALMAVADVLLFVLILRDAYWGD